jgi:DNA repair protein RadA/Sms
MAKQTAQYVCEACGATFAKWSGKCLNCGAWETIAEVTNAMQAPGQKSVARIKASKLSDVKAASVERISVGIGEVDTVLGGGLVPGSLVLLAGDPGIGKSTLVLQLASNVAKSNRVLYVSGEESPSQIKLRADRLREVATEFDFLASTDADQVLAQAGSGEYDLIIVDSIQTMVSNDATSAISTVGQITNITARIMNVAKGSHTAFVIIGHVTKEGNVAGPRVLEHLVDAVLYLEGEKFGSLKVLRANKNRFGSTNEVGILEMSDAGLSPVDNPSAALLAERQHLPGSIVFAAMEGSRPIMVEVQALVSPSVFGYPKRTAVGVDMNRLGLLAAVMTKRGGINLSSSDIYVNIVGGLKVNEPAIDLAIILAIASAHKGIVVPSELTAFGEIGLSGELRSVSFAERRLEEASRQGFSKALVSPQTKATRQSTQTIKVKTIAEAIKKISNT